MAAVGRSGESDVRPLPPAVTQEGTDALRSPDGTAAGDPCKASPPSARRPAPPRRFRPRPAAPPPPLPRGVGWAPPAAPATALAAAPHAHRHEVGRDRLVADDLGLDRALDLLQPRDLVLQLLRAPLELRDPALHPLQRSLELEHLLDAGEVHAGLRGQLLDAAQPLDV